MIRFIVLYLIFLCIIFLIQKENFEEPGQKKKKKISKDLIGREKMVHVANLVPIFPNIAVPLRDQVHTWIVNVPLTPFKAPLVKIPKVDKIFPFLLYKTQYLTPIRNQGDCGSCWAFALCDQLADQAMIMSGGLFRENLSVQQLLECYKKDGCDGGSPENASMWLEEKGVELATEKEYPYREYSGGYVNGTCRKNVKGNKVKVDSGSVASIVEFIPEEKYDEEILKQNILNMKKTLIEKGPFYCAMTVYDDLFTYTGTSVYKKGKNASIIGGHAIEIIGYAEKGVDNRKGFQEAYWICRNSWGETWPTKSSTPGYFSVKMGVNMCGIESRCGYAVPKIVGKYAKSKEVLKLSDLRFEKFPE